MRTLAEKEDVIHVEADRKRNRVWIWTRFRRPQVDRLRKQIEEADFKATGVHSRLDNHEKNRIE